MEGHAKKCVGRYWELANKTVEQLYKVSTPCPDDHHFKKEELEMVEELSKVCCQIVLKYQNLARIIGRPDILWSVNKLARAVTKWTRACEKRVARSISYIHQMSEFEQHCHVGNTAQQCRLDCFKTLTLPDLLRTQNRHQEDLCAYLEVTHQFQQVGRARNKHLLHTPQPKLRLFLLIQVYARMGFQLSIFGIS